MTDHTTTELLPCPFCGSTDISEGEILGYKQPSGESYVQTVCNDCEAAGPAAKLRNGEVDYGSEKANAQWNRRAAISAPDLIVSPLTGPEALLISQVFAQFRKDACLPGDDRISESFIKAAGALMGSRAKPVAWLIRWPNGNEEAFMDLKIAVQQAAMFKTKPIPLGVIAAQSEPATCAVLVAGDASIEYAENLRDVWEGKPLREKKKHRWDTDAERCLDCGQSEYIGGECIPTAAPTPDSAVPVASYVDIVFDGPPRHESGRFVEVESPVGRSINFGEWIHRDDGYWALRFTAPTPDAERHVANHAGDLQIPEGYALVKVSAQGVQFGNAWYSHEKITGYTAEQLNEGNCRVTGRAYMQWLAAPAQPTDKENGN